MTRRRTAASPTVARDFPYEAAGEDEVTRREFARYLVLGAGAFAAGNVGIAVWTQLRTDQHRRAPTDRRPRRRGRRATPTCSATPPSDDPAILVRLDERELVAFSQKCTHLGCVVYYEADESRWHCPCHEGNFDARTGAVISGPPPRPLGRIDVEVRDDGMIWALGAGRSEASRPGLARATVGRRRSTSSSSSRSRCSSSPSPSRRSQTDDESLAWATAAVSVVLAAGAAPSSAGSGPEATVTATPPTGDLGDRATLFPGYFALVMATGIIAIGAAQQDLGWLADGLFVDRRRRLRRPRRAARSLRLVRFPRLLAADLTSHAKGFAFLTIVAATNVLGSAAAIIHDWWDLAWVLWWISLRPVGRARLQHADRRRPAGAPSRASAPASTAPGSCSPSPPSRSPCSAPCCSAATGSDALAFVCSPPSRSGSCSTSS